MCSGKTLPSFSDHQGNNSAICIQNKSAKGDSDLRFSRNVLKQTQSDLTACVTFQDMKRKIRTGPELETKQKNSADL